MTRRTPSPPRRGCSQGRRVKVELTSRGPSLPTMDTDVRSGRARPGPRNALWRPGRRGRGGQGRPPTGRHPGPGQRDAGRGRDRRYRPELPFMGLWPSRRTGHPAGCTSAPPGAPRGRPPSDLVHLKVAPLGSASAPCPDPSPRGASASGRRAPSPAPWGAWPVLPVNLTPAEAMLRPEGPRHRDKAGLDRGLGSGPIVPVSSVSVRPPTGCGYLGTGRGLGLGASCPRWG